MWASLERHRAHVRDRLKAASHGPERWPKFCCERASKGVDAMSNDSPMRAATEQIDALLREREQLAVHIRLSLLSTKSEIFRAKAEQCDERARAATLAEVKHQFQELGRLWRAMSEDWDRMIADRSSGPLARSDRPERTAERAQRKPVALPPNFGAGLGQHRQSRAYYFIILAFVGLGIIATLILFRIKVA